MMRSLLLISCLAAMGCSLAGQMVAFPCHDFPHYSIPKGEWVGLYEDAKGILCATPIAIKTEGDPSSESEPVLPSGVQGTLHALVRNVPFPTTKLSVASWKWEEDSFRDPKNPGKHQLVWKHKQQGIFDLRTLRYMVDGKLQAEAVLNEEGRFRGSGKNLQAEELTKYDVVWVGDLNQDGRPDLLYTERTNSHQGSLESTTINILLSKGQTWSTLKGDGYSRD